MTTGIGTNPIKVRVEWRADGTFAVSGEWKYSGADGKRARYAPVEPTQLKHLLMAWHAPSYYGTLLETVQTGGFEGFALPADWAVDLFAESDAVANPFGSVEWDEQAEDIRRIARQLKAAADAGDIVPDYDAWRQGRLAWRMRGVDMLRDAGPLAAEWTEQFVRLRLERQGGLLEQWNRVQAAFPAMQRQALADDVWADEEDWLLAIGWTPDDTPFRVELRLEEPALPEPDAESAVPPDGDIEPSGSESGGRPPIGDEAWTLRTVIVPADPSAKRPRELAVTPDGGLEPLGKHGRNSGLPDEWAPYADRLYRRISRVGKLVSWLRAEPADAQATPPKSRLTPQEAWRFLAEAAPILHDFGYGVRLPDWWEELRRLRPKLRARARTGEPGRGGGRSSLLGLDQIVQFDWKLAIGNLELTEAEFRELAERSQPLARIRGQWVHLDPATLAQLRRLMNRTGAGSGLRFRDVLEMELLGGTELPGELAGEGEGDGDESVRLQLELELNAQLAALIGQLRHTRALPPWNPPSGLRGELRPYQREGAAWLSFLRRFGFGACLADDMGLGKTIQFIAYLLAVREEEPDAPPALLVCPTSVLGNWQKELERFAPGLHVKLHYGPGRRKGESFGAWIAGADIVVTSYALAHLDEEELASVEWTAICLDEAQNIKNAQTKQSAAVRRLSGRHRIALTGTPVENRLAELWSIFDFLNPGYLGALPQFNRRFGSGVERSDSDRTGALQKLIQPFLLRRVKTDPAVGLDLPDKMELKAYVQLTPEQAALYEHTVNELFREIGELEGMQRRGRILSALLRLKQLCDHPALYNKEPDELLTAEGGDMQISRSRKLERIVEMVQELREEGDRCLIFTQFIGMGRLLQSVLRDKLGERVPFLHGGVPKAERDAMIAEFQAGGASGPGVFVLSLKAGGTGLNLTAANHVFHYDRWWNPAVENQATDRAYRIGQSKRVQVHKFVTLGTLEERIDELLERKQELGRAIIGGGEQWITELSTDELRDLFRLRREWIQ
ncbi:DEAD/DEAH box helicase [Paenibacillus thermoaerophilus]|uniref:DEAD/DEAH box helicase n=1 Tax=Paenibacillus thermoaerophilus TaxID=1215385 RepID=A0ABW2V342_9BACL|nr:DEAD/DEAH box helicase [Paenibacillus thermoaerophilus]TMV14385.1 DEAD/DEAH box helicase [Paenibacillus thermoaerophilus]